jgi:steroid 5-alpha reductase family enzyme
METISVLAVNAAISAAVFLGLWRYAVAKQDPSFIDSWWGAGMALIAVLTFVQSNRGPHALALTLLGAAWGLRLGYHLIRRWRREGPDRRYSRMMADAKETKGWSFAKASLIYVFAFQALLQFIVCLPVQVGQLAPSAALGALAWAGVAVAVIGITFETVGDAQLERFRADPSNAGKVLDTGLWRYTRHPNYFGDACTWWGLYLIAADTGLPGALTIVGPVLLTFLLTRWSGVPTTEGPMRRRKPGYEAYVARTSGFIPMPPKRGS